MMAAVVKLENRTFILGSPVDTFADYVYRFGYTYPRKLPADLRRAFMRRDYRKITGREPEGEK